MEDVRIFYLRDMNNHPRGAVGIKENDSGGHDLSFCICCRKDNFSREKARLIVEGRLYVGKMSHADNSDYFELRTALAVWGLLSVAKKQNINLTRAEYILKKILANKGIKNEVRG